MTHQPISKLYEDLVIVLKKNKTIFLTIAALIQKPSPTTDFIYKSMTLRIKRH